MEAAFKTRADSRQAFAKAGEETPAIPINVDLELSSICSANCPFCHFGGAEHPAFLAQKLSDGKPKGRFMPPAMAFKIIDECREIGVPVLKMNSRGESGIHPSYSEILSYAARDSKFHDILINTHGDLPRASWLGVFMATKVMISLDSLRPETHARMRAGLDLDNVKTLIRYLLEQEHPNVWLRRVVTKLNKDEPFFEDCRREFPGVKVSEHACFDRNEKESHSTEPIDKSWPRRYCGQPSWRLTVRSNGDIVPCCVTWEDELIMGHYPEDSLLSVWRGEKMATLRGQLKAGIFRAEICKNCTSYSAYDRPERKFLQDLEGVKI